MINIFVIGVSGKRTELTNFTSARCKQTLIAVSGEFSFESTSDVTQGDKFKPDRNSPYPVQIGDQCVVQVDGVDKVNGFVERVDVSYDSGSHNVIFSGRDVTADLIDATFPVAKSIVLPKTILEIVEEALRSCGIPKDQPKLILSDPGATDSFEKNEVVKWAAGQNCLEFIDTYARKRQLIMYTLGDKALHFSQANPDFESMRSVTAMNSLGAQSNNIKRATLNRDYTQRFAKYTCISQGNASASDFSEAVVDDKIQTHNITEGIAIDKDMENIRPSREYTFKNEASGDGGNCKQRAKWEANLRKSNSFTYMPTFAGHSATVEGKNIPWLLNAVIGVNDDFSDINGGYLIRDIEWSVDHDNGSETTVTLVDPSSFQAEITTNDEDKNKSGLRWGDS